MSKPRRIVPGATYAVSRRVSERRFLLRPDSYVTQVFLYCLAYAAETYGILVHSFNVMTNHLHLDLTDPLGQLPRFMELLDGLLARALNAYYGRWESFFAPGSYSARRIDNPRDILDKIVYTLTNPVAAGLVSHAHHWEGATSVRWRFGESRTLTRPAGPFFGPDSRLPESVTLTLATPPLGLTAEGADHAVHQAIAAREAEIRAQFHAAGWSFKGMDVVMQLDPYSRPSSIERRRRLNPHVAGKDVEGRVAAIIEVQEFRAAYRTAWVTWRDGNREGAVFPYGTWLMRVRHRARCQPPPPS